MSDKELRDQTDTEFDAIGEIALRMNLSSDETTKAPQYELFTNDEGTVRSEKCLGCNALYAIGYSRIYRTKRSFEDLSDQLQLRLEEDHLMKRNHASLIFLRLDPTRKRSREQKP